MSTPHTDDPDDQQLSLRPPRKAFILAYLGVVLAGLLGAAIGGGLVDSMCTPSRGGGCGTPVAVGAIVGGVAGAVGVGIVAVLVLRAMHEWNEYQARAEPPTG